MATKTDYSHAFLVGSFNGQITPQQLNNTQWKKVDNTIDYSLICSIYYQGHVDAMLDGNNNRATFLRNVCHYKLAFEEQITDGKMIAGQEVSMILEKNMGKDNFTYTFRLMGLHLYFFPLNTTLIAIEIDDTGTELDDLTAAHSSMALSKTYNRDEIKSAFSSLSSFLPAGDFSLILGAGNKFKLYQVIEIETKEITDSLLYEIGTSSPIGCVGTNHQIAPSKSYFDNIMKTNIVSAFNDWKGLALMDSFTMISNAEKREDWSWEQHFYLWNNHYFQLIYLRALLEKTFCFSRNSAYRMDENTQNLSQEVSDMERYYFYDKISYNFLPNLLYKAIAKGMELKEEREELSKQIKERTKQEDEKKKEKEENRRDIITLGLSIFAVFSIAWDLCEIIKDAFTGDYDHETAFVIFWCAIGVILVLAAYIFVIKKYANK